MSSNMFKFLVIGHHIVVKEYQELWVSAASQFRDISFSILCPKTYAQNGINHAEALNPKLVPVISLPALFARSGRQHLHLYFDLESTIKEIGPDFIYCAEESNSCVTAQVAHVCRKLQIPFTFWTSLNQIRNYKQMYSFLNPRRYLFDRCQKYVFANCTGATPTSEAAVKVLLRQGFNKSYICKPTHGIGENFLAIGRSRVERSLTPETLHIGYVGHYWDWKGIDILLKAYGMMRKKAMLTLHGSGQKEQELKNLAHNLGLRNINWKPRVPYTEMPGVMRNLDVFVLPSLQRGGINEKFGRVIIEAMAAGAVGVGSNDGGIPSAMANGGILFPPGDARMLAEVLDKLASDSEFWKQTQILGFNAVNDTYRYEVISRNIMIDLSKTFGIPLYRSAAPH